MPILIVIAGANGSGKSTLTKLLAGNTLLIDPDAIAKEIDPVNPSSVAIAAARQALSLCQQYIRMEHSFMVETTLAGNTYLNLMRDVKQRGWAVDLIYIGIADPNLNVLRVSDRVNLGGHDVPRSDILRRYERSLNNLVKAAKIVDSHSERLCQRLSLYDNSTSAGHQLVATRDRERTVIYMQELPGWIDRANLNL